MYKSRTRFVQRITGSNGDRKKFDLDRRPRNNKAHVPMRYILAKKDGKPVHGSIIGRTKGGFKVNINGFIAFCPDSHMSPPVRVEITDVKTYFKNSSFEFTILNAENKSLVVSRKESRKKGTIQSLRSGDLERTTVRGVVKSAKPFGVFVDIGGLDGLVHISSIEDKFGKDSIDIFKPGDHVIVRILYFNESFDRISLTIVSKTENPGKFNDHKKLIRKRVYPKKKASASRSLGLRSGRLKEVIIKPDG